MPNQGEAQESGSSGSPVGELAHSPADSRPSPPMVQEYFSRDITVCADSDFNPHWEGEAGLNGDVEAGRQGRSGRRRGSNVALATEDSDESRSGASADGQTGPVLLRRPSDVASDRPAVAPALLLPSEDVPASSLTRIEKKASREAERSLLPDNHVVLPRRPRPPSEPPSGMITMLYKRLFSTRVPQPKGDEEAAASASTEDDEQLSETSPLLSGATAAGGSRMPPGGSRPRHEHLDEMWEAAFAAGQVETTWQREAKTLALYSRSLIFTFLLQYSINITSIFAVGRIGRLELGAVSLATMTANITCYAPIQGLATSLDTLCAQAYGSGHKHLVGLQLQRMTYFLLLLIMPVIVVWHYAEGILASMIPERRSAELAAIYLRVAIFGTPAFVFFEGGKRFVQAQGLFHATTYVLAIAAPFNILLNYLLVWKLGFGYVGAPMAVVATQWLMPILLLLYVRFVDGSQCWGGFTKRALYNWGPMVFLALPGMVMVEAEYLAFEVLTLIAGQFGTSQLAAQSILVTIASTTFQLPFPLSIAASTRVANLIGAKLVSAAKTSAKVAVYGSLVLAAFNLTTLWSLRYQLPKLFTNDTEVIALVVKVMPLLAVMQIFDGLAAVSHGLLRGLGRQSFGGYINLFVYYAVALPVSIGTSIGLDWKLAGLWLGVTIGLLLVGAIEYLYIYRADWNKTVKEAETRNAAG